MGQSQLLMLLRIGVPLWLLMPWLGLVVLNGGVEDPSADVVLHGGAHALGMVRTDACLTPDDDSSITLHGGAVTQPDVVALVDVIVDGIFTNAEYQAAMSMLAFSDFEDSFILRSSSLFSPYISSLTSTLTSDITCLLYSSLPLSYNNFPGCFSFSVACYVIDNVSARRPSSCRFFTSACPITTLDTDQPKASSLSAINFLLKCSRATPSHLHSASERCHSLQLPSLFQTNPRFSFKFSITVPDVVPLAHSPWHVVALLDNDWSTHNSAVVASGCVDGKALIWNVEGVVFVFKGWGHEGQAGFIKIFNPACLIHLHLFSLQDQLCSPLFTVTPARN